jgi:hypothetical protein
MKKDFSIYFDSKRLQILILGVGLLILGNILMAATKSDPIMIGDPKIYSFRTITLAPITILLGYFVIIFSILKKSK